MVHQNRRNFLAQTLAASGVLLGASAWAQNYPNKVIKMVVPFPPGGGGDMVGRLFAKKLSEALGVPVIVENKPGASSVIGTDAVAKSAPDGYTILLNVSLIVQTASLFSKWPYDPLVDLTPVTDLSNSALWFAVSTARTEARTLKDFVSQARLKPLEYTYASIGTGSSSHLLGYAFNEANGLNMMHVPYKGSSPATLALVAGEVSAIFMDYVTLQSQMGSGKVRLLAVTGNRRSALTPDVPTLAELGYPGFEPSVWSALFVPSKTPRDIVARLETEIRQILTQPDMVAKWRELGYESGGMPQAQFAAQVRSDHARWGELIRKTGVKLD